MPKAGASNPRLWPCRPWTGAFCVLKRFALNLNHLTLPEIKDFNALSDTLCIKLTAKRYSLIAGACGARIFSKMKLRRVLFNASFTKPVAAFWHEPEQRLSRSFLAAVC